MTGTTLPSLAVEEVAIDDLRPDPANPRRIGEDELDALERSLRQFGFVQPVLARREDRTVIGGHQRLVAARRLGLTAVPVTWLDISVEQARLLGLALNKISGTWDEALLARLLADLGATPDLDLSLSGFGEDEIGDLLRKLEVREKRESASASRPRRGSMAERSGRLGQGQDMGRDRWDVRIRLSGREHRLSWHVEGRQQGIGQERVGPGADELGHVVLEQTVGGIDLRAQQLLPSGDVLDHVAAVVEHELEAEIVHPRARAAGARPERIGLVQTGLERGMAGAQAGQHVRTANAQLSVGGDGEDGIALKLRQSERRRHGGQDRLQQTRHERIRGRRLICLDDQGAVRIGHALQEAGVSGDVGEEECAERIHGPGAGTSGGTHVVVDPLPSGAKNTRRSTIRRGPRLVLSSPFWRTPRGGRNPPSAAPDLRSALSRHASHYRQMVPVHQSAGPHQS